MGEVEIGGGWGGNLCDVLPRVLKTVRCPVADCLRADDLVKILEILVRRQAFSSQAEDPVRVWVRVRVKWQV